MENKDTYLLARGVHSSIRLTAQHLLWKDHIGWNLHPSALSPIPASNNTGKAILHSSPSHPLAVADIACGNGLWLLQESQSPTYPPHTTFTGFDISPSQFPSPSTIPSSVTFTVLNASHPSLIPSQYHSAFDIVHVRLLMGSITGPSPIHFLQSFLTLLRPGGFLQWDEVNPHKAQALPASTSDSASALGEKCKWESWIPPLIATHRPNIEMKMNWLDSLPALFEAEGMTDIQRIQPGPPKPHMRRPWTDNDFGVMTEIASSMGVGKDVLAELEEGWRERKWEIMYEINIFMGRKGF